MSDRLGPYRILERLGKGGMGEVFLAHDDRLKRRVAVKRLRPDRLAGASDSQRLRREAQAAAGLKHSAIVQIYDILEDSTGEWIVMEYVPGSTVASLLEEGLFDQALAIDLARQIALGLAEAHKRGLIHRDLKAENVVVTPEGEAKILDFGIVKPIAGLSVDGQATLTATGAVVGTSRSMSPEQAGGETLDSRSDLFSLGVLLYEMLTGRSPFQAESPLQTLKNVLTQEPAPVSLLRPDTAQELSDLVDQLLAKDRTLRPGNAAEVARELDRIGRLPSAGGVARRKPESEAAGGDPTLTQTEAAVPASASPPVQKILIAAAAVLATLSLVLLMTWNMEPKPLRVAVLKPSIGDGGRMLELAASNVASASVETLVSLRGTAPLDSSTTQDFGTPVETARALAADETLSSTVEAQGDLCRITLRRAQGETGQVVWTQSFQARCQPAEARILADAVRLHLRDAYRDYPLRPGFSQLEARPEDYAAFLQVKLRALEGTGDLEPMLAELESILATSPRFVAAWQLSAELSHSLFSSTRDRRYFERGMHFVEQAARWAPGDPRPEIARIRLLEADNQLGQAEAAILQARARSPGDPELLWLLSDNLARRGRHDEAILGMREVVEQTPSWQNLYRLARMEYRVGRVEEARRHLEASLQRAPGNRWGLALLGQLELVYGDLSRAETVFLDLSQSTDSRNAWTNLGLSRFLQGRYPKAVQAYQEALRLSPGNPSVMLNLADAQLSAGNVSDAEGLYRRLAAALSKNEDRTLSTAEELIRAQCLAHLGRRAEAVEAIQETLGQNPDDSEVLYTAALVYALAEDRTSALVNAKKALAKGYAPRWFTIPAFDGLRALPEFEALVRQSSR